jgi:maltose alpha-D-glucosyltransferase/alpha-amylase
VEYASAEPERFVVPLAFVKDGRTSAPPPSAVMATVRLPAGDVLLIDAAEDPTSARGLLQMLANQQRTSGTGTAVEATSFVPLEIPDGDPANISQHHAAAALRYGDRYLLKMFRRVEDGVSPELEVTRFINERAPTLTPRVAGALELRRGRGEPSTLAVLQAYVANEGTAWMHAREELRRFFERVLSRHRDTPPPTEGRRRLLEAARAEPPAVVKEIVGAYLEVASLLGRRTADLHLALASDRSNPAFRPEPYAVLDRRSKYQSMRNLAGKTLRLLRESLAWLPPAVKPTAHELAAHPDRVLKAFEPLLGQKLMAMRIRIHGDYHLDQILSTGKDFVIIDFEGQADTTLPERRRKHSAFRDVAGMLRSFHYAAKSAELDATVVREVDREAAAPWAEAWHRWISAAFLRTYLEVAGDAPFVPRGDELELTLDVHLVEKALHELNDELVTRSATASIPLAGLLQLLDR